MEIRRDFIKRLIMQKKENENQKDDKILLLSRKTSKINFTSKYDESLNNQKKIKQNKL